MDDPQATTSMVPNGRRTPTPRTLSYGKRSGGRILEEEESPLIGECAHANGDYFDRTPARTTPAEIEDPLESASSEDEEPGATDAGTRGALGASSDAALLQSGKVSSNPGLRSRVSAVRRPGGALRKWQTESNRRGQRGQNPYRSSNLKRTETSHLNHAIWQRYGEGTASGSASSTSSDAEDGIMLEEDGETQEREDMELRRRKTREAQKQRKDSLLDRPDADERYRHFLVGNENYQTKGKVKKDGRLRITVNEAARTGYLAKTLGTAIHRMSHAKEGSDDATPDRQMKNIPSRAPTARPFKPKDLAPLPKLNIVVMVIGSRGDVQPFLRIGKVLKEDYGHRVRIATHPAYRKFVEEDSQLEFFSVGGDPSELMAFMVKNPGLIPTLDTVKSGEIGRRRAAMAEMFDGFWRACIDATDDERDGQNLKMMGSKDPFVADAIIANPPSFAHIHCAEALGIPLHLMFTFPYTPTQVFPHPLASIKKSNVDPGYTNFISYPMVEMMVWQGLGDLVNDFRVKTLNLDPVSTLWAPGATYRLHVPFTYLWSPGIVAKPKDWGPHIDISGFVYLSLASSFEPPRDLEAFLDTGEPPIYIGFGSIVVDDPQKFTQLIFDAVAKAGVRALVSKGWGGLGVKETPDNIFMLENTPHDWLFPRVKAAVIHGGAGTTAIALKCGLPTFIVPFFGDQHFWGKMVSSSDVGPAPVPFKFLTVDNLAEGIRYCLTAEAKTAAMRVAKAIEREGDGAVNACRAFHEHLNLRGQHTMRCSLLPDQIAAWSPKNTSVKLSPLAADILVDAGYASYKRLRLIRHTEWNDFEGPGEPITGIAGSLASTVRTAFSGVAGVPVHLARTTRKMRKARKSSTERPKGAGGTLANGNINEMANGTSQPVASSGLPASELDRQLHLRAPTDLPEEYAGDLAHGVGRTAYAIAKAPVDLSMALAQGFHNAPRLYGDDTVRRPTRVTGIRSGLRAARKEFAYGVYDGFTGVVRLPARGARSGGAAGFAKGAGMGLLGLVIKNVGAVVGPAGYALKGLVKQAERSRSPQKFVRRARIAQGQRAGAALSDAAVGKLERTVADGYSVMRDLGDAIREEARERGFAGQLDRVLVDTGVLFESVDVSRKALAALRRGESLESVLRPFAGKKRGGAIPQVRRTLNRRRAATLPARRDDGGQVGREPRARDGASKTEDRGPGLASASLSRSMTAGL